MMSSDDGSTVKTIKVDYVKVRLLANKMEMMPGSLDITAIKLRCAALDMPGACLPVVATLEKLGWCLDSAAEAITMSKVMEGKRIREDVNSFVDPILSGLWYGVADYVKLSEVASPKPQGLQAFIKLVTETSNV